RLRRRRLGQKLPALDQEQRGGHDEEFARHFEFHFLHRRQVLEILVGNLADPDVADVDFRPVDEVQEQVEGAFENRKPVQDGHTGNALSRFAVSMADMAASQPLLPAFVPALSSACSIVSVVSTPKMTASPVCIAADATHLASSLLTYSKCGVAPLITTPRGHTTLQSALSA